MTYKLELPEERDNTMTVNIAKNQGIEYGISYHFEEKANVFILEPTGRYIKKMKPATFADPEYEENCYEFSIMECPDHINGDNTLWLFADKVSRVYEI